VFNEQTLAEIALSLDERERAVMAENGLDSAEFMAFSQEASGNVALDGNFSIQVLDEALRVWNLSCTPLASTQPCAVAARRAPLRERGFLCNLDKHWLSLRRLGTEWWNFNSLEAAPAPVSDTYLNELLAQLQAEGYTVFVVTGEWSARNSMYGEASQDGAWLTREQAAQLRAAAARDKVAGRTRTAAENALARAARGGGQLTLRGWGGANDDGEDPELRRALAASMGEVADGWAADRSGGGGGGSGGGGGGGGAAYARSPVGGASGVEDEDEALARAIAASLDEPQAKRRERVPPGAPPAPPPDAEEADPELAAALAASLAPATAPPSVAVAVPVAAAPAAPPALPREPDASEPGALQLALRLPSGVRATRFFLASDTLAAVAAAVQQAHGVDMRAHALTAGFPPRALAPPTATLAELGVTHKSVVSVTPA
jgi:ataxin-3